MNDQEKTTENGTNCKECIWCKKSGIMGNYHCFAPCLFESEMIQGYHMTFLQHVGCKTFQRR